MRRLTAAAILCLTIVAILWGWQATSFALARDSENANRRLPAWFGVPGLSSEALGAFVNSENGAKPPVLREAELENLLTARPMAAGTWLSLAVQKLVLDRPVPEVDAAVNMSQITGPNEGAVMWQRGVLELMRWNAISADARRQAAVDLAGAMHGGIANDIDLNLAKAILAKQSSQARAEIAVVLDTVGLTPAQIARIGLQSDTGEPGIAHSNRY